MKTFMEFAIFYCLIMAMLYFMKYLYGFETAVFVGIAYLGARAIVNK